MLLIIALCAGAAIVVPNVAHADGLLDFQNTFFSLAIDVLQGIVKLFGNILTFLIDIFLSFAQYNHFGDALPVRIGWTLVRDVCNMFFIVFLLLHAFGTILPFDTGFGYKQIPGLLVTVVLINFSKTLVMILIDISQVIMLTFVQAFAQSGAGNFAQLFGLTGLLQANMTQAGSNTISNLPSFINIFITYLLAIILLVIACGTMIVMVIYILARIIALWMLLIFSPAGFFMSAIPSKLKGSLGELGKFWSKLGPTLTGGPVVAFFVWLALATVQQSGGQAAGAGGSAQAVNLSSSLQLYTPPASDTSAAGLDSTLQGQTVAGAAPSNGFLSSIGNTQGIATFIIGVAMMLMGLETAAKVTGEVNDFAGTYAKKAAGYTKQFAKATAKWSAIGATGYGAGGAALGALGLGTGSVAANTAAGITLGVGGSKLSTFSKRIGQDAVGTGATLARGAGLTGIVAATTKDFGIGGKEGVNLKEYQMMRETAAKKEAEEQGKHSESLTGWKRKMEQLPIIGAGKSTILGFQKEEKMKKAAMLAVDTKAAEKNQKGEMKSATEKKKAELIGARVSVVEAEKGAAVFAQHQSLEAQRSRLTATEAAAKAAGDEKTAGEMKEIREKDPSLLSDDKAVQAWAEANAGPDKAKERAALSGTAANDARLHAAVLKQNGALIMSADGKSIAGVNPVEMKRVLRDNKDTAFGRGMAGTASYLSNDASAGHPVAVSDLGSLRTVDRVGQPAAVYDGKTGQRKISANEQTAIRNLETGVNSTNTPAANMSVIDSAMKLGGMNHAGAEAAAGDGNKAAVTSAITYKATNSLDQVRDAEERLSALGTLPAGATQTQKDAYTLVANGLEQKRAEAAQSFGAVMKDLGGLSNDSRNAVIKKLVDNMKTEYDQGKTTTANALMASYDSMSNPDQQKGLVNLIDHIRDSDAAENKVAIEQMKKVWPRDGNTAAGRKTPSGIRKALHGEGRWAES